MQIDLSLMKANPRVLFICPLPPPVHGSSMVSDFIRKSELIQGEFDCDFVNLSTSRKMEELGSRSKYVLFKKQFRVIDSFVRALWKLIFHQYDLCYLAIKCHGIGFLKDLPFVVICKLLGSRAVIHIHNKGISEDVDDGIYRKLYKFAYKNVKLILLSWHLYPEFAEFIDKKDVLVCPNGIKSGLDDKLERSDISPAIDSEFVHLFMLSNLLVAKGVLILLDALKMLNERGCHFICDFVGSETKDINAISFNEEVAKRGLENTAFYHGRKYGDEKEMYWKKSDIFILPSLNEAFPLVILEAMEHGIPVISTNVGGIPDEIDNNINGIVIPPGNAAALADAIETLIRNKELRLAMGSAGRKIFNEKYTIERFENNLRDCLLSCLQ